MFLPDTFVAITSAQSIFALTSFPSISVANTNLAAARRGTVKAARDNILRKKQSIDFFVSFIELTLFQLDKFGTGKNFS